MAAPSFGPAAVDDSDDLWGRQLQYTAGPSPLHERFKIPSRRFATPYCSVSLNAYGFNVYGLVVAGVGGCVCVLCGGGVYVR